MQAQEQTFSLANMVPQTPELNCGVWEGIERAVRRLAARRGELYVITDPAFQGQQIQIDRAEWRAGAVLDLEGGL